MDYTIAEPLVTLENVSKRFGNKLIIRDIGTPERPFLIPNVTRPDMQQGQTVAVVGASGSGKSTLFKLIAGIYPPTTGSIMIPDPDNSGVYRKIREGDIGLVQQTYPLSRNQSVYSMLNDAARQGNVPKSERKDVIWQYLEGWNLTNQKHLAKNQLSGGQRQRVAIIEQLLCSHHFLIFDEPFSGLDVRNIEDVKESFRKITTSSEIGTIIFSTHDIHLAVELADMVAVMGNEWDAEDKLIPGGTVVKIYDLKTMGLAWRDYCNEHQELGREIENIIKAQ